MEEVGEELELVCFELEIQLELVVLIEDELGDEDGLVVLAEDELGVDDELDWPLLLAFDELDWAALVVVVVVHQVVVVVEGVSVFEISVLASRAFFQSRTPPKAGMATARRRRAGLTMMGSIV